MQIWIMKLLRSDIKILKQIHSLGDEQYKRLMAYMKALQKLEADGEYCGGTELVVNTNRMISQNRGMQ